MTVRKYEDTGKVFRIHIDHLTSDGTEVYLSQTFGPFATKRAARIQASRRLRDATQGYHKATARIEAAPTDWKEIPL